MNITERLNSIIEKWNLLNHPFYQTWSNGTLPDEKLQIYAGEYASFINTVAGSWDACGYPEIAKTEREHYGMWVNFAKSLENNSFSPALPAMQELVSACGENNKSAATALGGLYAFEAQQPYTAQSKLKGLQTHYNHLHCDETYFRVHEYDFDEPALLSKHLESLSSSAKDEAARACEITCQKLWAALTAIYNDPVLCN